MTMSRLRVLKVDHVDDKTVFLKRVRTALHRPDIELRSYTASEAALQSRECSADLVIFDTEGVPYVRTISKRASNTTFILLSGKSTKKNPIPGVAKGLPINHVLFRNTWARELPPIIDDRLQGQVACWLNNLEFGEHKYPFQVRDRMTMVFWPTAGEAAIVDTTDYSEVGFSASGADSDTAFNELKRIFHVEFQQLNSRLRSGLSENETDRFAQFENLIDMDAYKEGIPLIVRAFGRVESTAPFTVCWNGQGSPTELDLANARAELAGLGVGTSFEARVVLDRKTAQPTRVLTVEIDDEPPCFGDAKPSSEFARTDELPDVEWDSL